MRSLDGRKRNENRVAEKKKWSFVEIGVLAYVIYSSIGAVVGGIMFLIVGSVMSAMQNSANQQGLAIPAPNIGHIVQLIGGVLLVFGLIGGAASALYFSRQRANGAGTADDGTANAGDAKPSDLGDAVLGVVALEAASARRRRRLFNGLNNPGMGPNGFGGRPPGI